jgi:hypothetical protein
MMRKKKNSLLFPLILFVGVIAISIGAIVLADNLRKAEIDNPSEYASQDEIPRLTAEEAYQAVQNEGAVLLDTRSAASFQAQRATGAINIPVDELEGRLDELDPDTWYITYCT